MDTQKTKNVGYIFASKVLSFFTGLVRGLFVPVYLGPSLYGVIGLLKLVKVVLGFTASGMDQAYLRLGIDLKEKGAGREAVRHLHDNVFTFFLIISVLGTVLTAVFPFVFPREEAGMQSVMVFCFVVTAVQFFFQNTGLFYFQTAKIEKRFKFISAMNVLQPIFALVLIISTVFKWKVRAVFAADLISVIVVQLLYLKKAGFIPSVRIHYEEFKHLIKYSFPFLCTAVCFYAFRFADRTIIAAYLSLRELGIYSFAMGLAENSRLLSVSINEVNMPYVLEEISRTSSLGRLSGTIRTYSYKLMAVNFVFAFAGILLAPVINTVFPGYSDGVFVLKMLLIIMVLRSFPLYQIAILGSPEVNRQNLINAAMGVCGAINVALSLVLVKMGYGINGVVIATLVVHLFMAVFYIIAAERYYLEKPDFMFYIKLGLPVIVIFIHSLLQSFMPFEKAAGWVINVTVAAMLSAPVLYIYRKESAELMGRIKGIFGVISG